MAMESPRSLTATIHVRFHYREPEAKPIGEREVEMVARILERAAELEPDLLEVLLKFVGCLYCLGPKEAGQSPVK